MKPIEIEVWALRVLEAAQRGAFTEDSLVELKAQWPEPMKAARQIAGHANAARGAPILWIVGVDEHKGAIGADYNELSSWISKVEAEFEGISPPFTSLNVPFGGVVVVAICFATDRAPFLVRNPTFNSRDGGPVSLEVPWRDGTRTRTAKRADLIQLLAPLRIAPTFDVLGGTLHAGGRALDKEGRTRRAMQAQFEFYVAPTDQQVVVFPFHKLRAFVAFPDGAICVSFAESTFVNASKRSYTNYLARTVAVPPVSVQTHPDILEVTASEVIVRGPGKLVLSANGTFLDTGESVPPVLRFDLTFLIPPTDIPCGFSCMCKQRSNEETADIWHFVPEDTASEHSGR